MYFPQMVMTKCCTSCNLFIVDQEVVPVLTQPMTLTVTTPPSETLRHSYALLCSVRSLPGCRLQCSWNDAVVLKVCIHHYRGNRVGSRTPQVRGSRPPQVRGQPSPSAEGTAVPHSWGGSRPPQLRGQPSPTAEGVAVPHRWGSRK